jgi:hypothetical protein
MIFKKKGQGAIEYLLIIGAALLVSIIVTLLILNMSSSKSNVLSEQDDALTDIIDNTIPAPIISILDCDDTDLRFVVNTPYGTILLVHDGGSPLQLALTNANCPNGVCTVTRGSSTEKHTLTAAAVDGSRISSFSKPISVCKP